MMKLSSKGTGGAIDGFIEGHQRGNKEQVGPLPLSMVSSKGEGGTMNSFIEGRQGGREQGTPHAQLDMRGISPVICSRKKLLDSGVWERNSLIQVFVLWLILS